jgi:hypothetical protein
MGAINMNAQAQLPVLSLDNDISFHGNSLELIKVIREFQGAIPVHAKVVFNLIKVPFYYTIKV